MNPIINVKLKISDIKPSNRKVTIMVNNENRAEKDPRIGALSTTSIIKIKSNQLNSNKQTNKQTGYIDISIHDLNPSGKPLDKWFNVQTLPDSSFSLPESASIRLKIALTVEKIMPFKEYKDFLEVYFTIFIALDLPPENLSIAVYG